MVLISYPECKKEVSDQAQSWPSCAHLFHAVTIELTGKKWKATSAISNLIICLGLGIFAYGGGELNYYSMFFVITGLVLIVAGYVGRRVADAGAWWNHE